MEAALRPANPALGTTTAAANSAAVRTTAVRPADPDSRVVTQVAPAAAPLKRGIRWDNQMQGNVARAQQALDYLERVASQLEALKADLSAKITGRSDPARQIEARSRQLSSALEARRSQGGGGIDAQLDFNGGAPAATRFRIRGFDVAALQSAGQQNYAFAIGSSGGPQLSATIEAGMTAQEIAARLDRTLSPVKVRVALDNQQQLVFSAPEAEWVGIKDAIAISGRGRVDTVEEPAVIAPQQWTAGNPDALRQSLREVVQALARVRRSQDAASAALSAAMMATATVALPEAEMAVITGDFAATAASHDYQSLLAITSALVGVSRERVQALLGLR
ncbi:hypothetical protein [Massilia yuzhufengensis]|uniref:Flagellin n=1 Tax=Massilia yuzhufengensis TaxID=1164594 RepID=A0A1I1FZR9_9BURK|nr:hypothetical protein [Massilia yuzhufengensis]SFC05089.1 hypothetical protein SAMN05216204_103157 [Massilia yuzhufengensis]